MRGLSRTVTVVTTAVLAALTVGVTAQVPANRPRITGIDHIVFRASDEAAARRFYGDVLGLLGSIGGPVARLRRPACGCGEGQGRTRIPRVDSSRSVNARRIYVESNLQLGRTNGSGCWPSHAGSRGAGRAPDRRRVSP